MAQDLLRRLVAALIPAAADMRLLGLKAVAEFLDLLEHRIRPSEVLFAGPGSIPVVSSFVFLIFCEHMWGWVLLSQLELAHTLVAVPLGALRQVPTGTHEKGSRYVNEKHSVVKNSI